MLLVVSGSFVREGWGGGVHSSSIRRTCGVCSGSMSSVLSSSAVFSGLVLVSSPSPLPFSPTDSSV